MTQEFTFPMGAVTIRAYVDEKGNRSVSGEDYNAWILAGWTAAPDEHRALEDFMVYGRAKEFA